MKKLEDKFTIGEILDFAEERGMHREDAYQEVLAYSLGNRTTYTSRIRAIIKEMNNESNTD